LNPVLGALALDLAVGEPPARLHPVVGMGRLLAALWPWAQGRIRGALAWTVGAGLVTGAYAASARALRRAPAAARGAAEAVLLKPLFSLRMLLERVAAVEAALERGDLRVARIALRHLVSRRVDDLSVAEVREAALESLAENLVDSVVAPLLAYAVGGLPAAALYRYANTADAMWGYPLYGDRGWWAARTDDALNLLPARLTGLLLAPPRAWRRLRREARRTPSPNGGWPMAALALRLHVRLRKRGVYTLLPEAPSPTPMHTRRALRWAAVVAGAIALVVAVAAEGG